MTRPYAAQFEPLIARAHSLIDRNPASPTHGCADRAFWQYRTLVNFPGSGWQNLMLGLALAGGDDNAKLARAALSWWVRLQHGDGSFDEWYRNEHSYCPTAFTAADAAQTMLILGDPAPEAVAALERAGQWLAARRNPTVMNQNLAAALAIWGLWRITGAETWRRAAEDKFAFIAREASAEGWLPEYSGFDYGYSTLALDLLAAADRLGASEMARPLAGGLAKLLELLVGPGDGWPGRLGCRGTTHVFTYGAEHFAAADPAAARLAARFRAWHATGRVAGPGQVDDRYFAYFHFSRFAQAWAFAPAELVPAEPVAAAAAVEFPGAGITVSRAAPGWQATVSRRLGNAFAIEAAGQAPLYHLGYELVLASGKRLSSAVWAEGAIGDEAPFGKVSGGQPLVRLAVPFHLFTGLLVSGRVAEGFQKIVKALMIKPKGKAPFRLRRRLSVDSSGLAFEDEIVALPGAPAVAAIHPTADIAVHSPSARQDGASALGVAGWDPAAAAAVLVRDGRVVARGRWPAPQESLTPDDATP